MNPLKINSRCPQEFSRWALGSFLRVVERNVQWAIENRAMYKLALHPSIMYVEDPQLKVVNLVCDLVNTAGKRAELVDLDAFSRRTIRQNG